MPTLCDLAGADSPSDICGRSLLPSLHSGEPDEAAAERREGLHMQIDRQHAWLEAPYKYLYFEEDGAELLFHLDEDPGETRDLSGDEALVAPLRRRFMAHLEAEGHPAIRDGRLVNEGQELDSDDGDYHAANVSGRPGEYLCEGTTENQPAEAPFRAHELGGRTTDQHGQAQNVEKAKDKREHFHVPAP